MKLEHPKPDSEKSKAWIILIVIGCMMLFGMKSAQLDSQAQKLTCLIVALLFIISGIFYYFKGKDSVK